MISSISASVKKNRTLLDKNKKTGIRNVNYLFRIPVFDFFVEVIVHLVLGSVLSFSTIISCIISKKANHSYTEVVCFFICDDIQMMFRLLPDYELLRIA